MLLLYPTKTCQLLLSVYCLLQLIQERWICFEERSWDSQQARNQLSILAAPCTVEPADLWRNASLQNTTSEFEKMYLEKASRTTRDCALLLVDDILVTGAFPVQLCCLRAAAAFCLASCLLLLGELIYYSCARKRCQEKRVLGPCTSASLQTILVVCATTSLFIFRLDWPSGPLYPAVWFWMEMICLFLAVVHCSQILFIGTWSRLEIGLEPRDDYDPHRVKTVLFTEQPTTSIEEDCYDEGDDY